MNKTPRVDHDEDGELVLLKSLHTPIKVLRWVLVVTIVISMGLAIGVSHLSQKVDTLSRTVKVVEQASNENLDTSTLISRDVRDAINRLEEEDSEAAAELDRVFRAVFDIQQILINEFGQ